MSRFSIIILSIIVLFTVFALFYFFTYPNKYTENIEHLNVNGEVIYSETTEHPRLLDQIGIPIIICVIMGGLAGLVLYSEEKYFKSE